MLDTATTGGSRTRAAAAHMRPAHWLRALADHWWQLTTPPPPSPTASLAQQQERHRSRIASIIFLTFLVMSLIPAPFYIVEPHIRLFVILLAGGAAAALAVNRAGHTFVASLLAVFVMDSAIMVTVATTSPGKLALLSLLVIPELIAASLLPLGSVFIIAAVHSLFILATYVLSSSEPVIDYFVSRHEYTVLGSLIFVQIFVAVVSYIWVKSTTTFAQQSFENRRLTEAREREIALAQQEAEKNASLKKEFANCWQCISNSHAGTFRWRCRRCVIPSCGRSASACIRWWHGCATTRNPRRCSTAPGTKPNGSPHSLPPSRAANRLPGPNRPAHHSMRSCWHLRPGLRADHIWPMSRWQCRSGRRAKPPQCRTRTGRNSLAALRWTLICPNGCAHQNG